MKIRSAITSLAILLTLVPRLQGAEVSWLPGETKSQQEARMAWWHEAKFGMFVHWGVYSIPADGEWHMRNQRQSFAEYSKFAAQFDPTNFNADEWMALAHDAGMKYLVITSKHHDGFAMFKSQASPYNIVDATPFKRDVLKELSEACPKHDIRFGIYYSFLGDWGHKGGGAGAPHWDPGFQDGDLHDYIKTVAVRQLKELMTGYGPISELWFDSDGSKGITPEESSQVIDILKTQPQLLVNPRLSGVKADFATSEQHMPPLVQAGVDWELCGTVNGSWGYSHKPAKPLNVLLPYMITAWGMDGNVLMNVGPTSAGVIPPDSAQRLREVGQWMKTYGESIYGSTAGPFPYLPWGTATRKGDTVYLQIFQWPADGKLRVPLLNEVKQATLLGSGKRELLKSTRENGRIVLQLPAQAPDVVANVVALQIEGAPQNSYVSVVLNKSVKASTGGSSAPGAVDSDRTTVWHSEESTGWLEMDAGKPMTVTTMRVSPSSSRPIKNCTFEYKEGNEWKPIFSSELVGDSIVKDFAPVTAQQFRLNVSDPKNTPQICNLELYPPL